MTLMWWQRLLLLIVIIGSVGTLTELLLLEHTEEFYQLVPVVLLGLVIVAAACVLLVPRRWSINLLRVVMALCIVSAALGIFFHYEGNTEFVLERTPDLKGWPLFTKAITGGNPALAPGAMVQLALIGLLATYSRRSA